MTNFDDLISLPFADGGRGPAKYDCWGLVREVYRRYGVNLPDYPISAIDAVKIGNQMTKDVGEWLAVTEQLPIPSLVVLRLACGSWANHVGVYLGNGKFIHAYKTSGVTIDRLRHWTGFIVGFYVQRGD